MKRLFLVVAAWLWLGAGQAAAGPLYVNFCPGGAGCPTGVTEASLTFLEVVSPDPNDYNLVLKITGNAFAPAFVDEVMFKIDGTKTSKNYPLSAGEYEALPSLISAPAEGAPWIVYFDNVSATLASCAAHTGSQQAVCSQSGPGDSTNYGASLPNQSLSWIFSVDLIDSEGALSTSTNVNLRAQFLNADGSNAGILSPGGKLLEPCPPTNTTCFPPTTRTPEPGTFLLLATGLAVLARRGRRRA